MTEKPSLKKMLALFNHIYDAVSSHTRTQAIVRLGLSRSVKERIVKHRGLQEQDVEAFLRVQFTRAFPRTAMTLGDKLKEHVEEAYRSWLEFASDVEGMLKQAGLSWFTVEEAADFLLRNPEAVRTLNRPGPRKLADFEKAASIAEENAQRLNIYTIPVCLRFVFPYVDPGKARIYVQEAKKAFSLIALAHLKKMLEAGPRNEFVLRRLAMLSELIKT